MSMRGEAKGERGGRTPKGDTAKKDWKERREKTND